jgi:serine/threonine protein kinase
VDDLDPDLTGQTLCGRWRLVRLLGRGGMSAVYEARETDGTRVAVKVLRHPSSRSTRIRQRFLREGRVANSVAHADAVRVFEESETPEGQPFLVMELLEGVTLRAACAADGPMETLRVLAIAGRVLDVLAQAHAVGVVHRDIKPENIFLTACGQVKVLDFGIAAIRDAALEDATITQSGATLGTPAFMAPEQARGRQADVEPRTDVWAVGATMFYCLTRRHVHEGASNANEAIIFAATLRAPALSRFRPDVPARVARIVDRALALEPGERWPTARAMSDAIAGVAECGASADDTGQPIPTPWTAETLDEPRPGRWRGAARGAIGWSVVGAVTICAILSGILRDGRRPAPARRPENFAAPVAAQRSPPSPPSPETPSTLPPEAPTATAVQGPPAVARDARAPANAAVPAHSTSAPVPSPSASLDVSDAILDRWR